MRPFTNVFTNMSATNTARRNRRERRSKHHVFLESSDGSEVDGPCCTMALVSASKTLSLVEAVLYNGERNSARARLALGECRQQEQELFHHSGWRVGSVLTGSQGSLLTGWDFSHLTMNSWQPCWFRIGHRNLCYESRRMICHSKVEELHLPRKTLA